MNIPALVEPIGSDKFRVTVFHLSAEGATAEKALAKVREELKARLRAGARIEAITAPYPNQVTDTNPWAEFAGMFEDDPQFDEFLEAMKEYRREVEATDEP